MPDQIGNIEVPEVAASGTFPLTVEFGFVEAINPEIKTHQFGAGNAKREQRFYLGTGARQWKISQDVTESERVALRDFWEARKGSYQPFTFHKPLADQTTEEVTAQFAGEPLVMQYGGGLMSRIDVTLIECNVGSGPTYTLNSTVTRFPSGTLATALLSQAQELIPLVRIVPRKAGYPDNIYLSDRRCTIDGQLYQARLLRWDGIQQWAAGVPGASVETDDATFVLGNADRVLKLLAEDVQLDLARVEFSLFHVGTGIQLDFWAGEIVPGGWTAGWGEEFQIKCSDPMSSPYMLAPARTLERRCQALYDDGFECPFASVGALDTGHFPDADAATCDRGYDTPNGCLAHGMKPYYRGVLVTPQPVRIKDNSSGSFGIGRLLITSVSLVADSAIGAPLPLIFTDLDMPVVAKLIAGRDESDFYEALGIVGEGPITEFGAPHKLDGQFNHGYPGSLGVREIPGSEPAGATDFLSLDQSGDQTNGDWRKVYSGASTFADNFSAGVAAVVIRRSDEKGIQPTRLDEHSMEVTIRRGLKGRTWSAPGVSHDNQLLTNPIWIALDLFLRALGMRTASAAAQELVFDVAAAVAGAAVCDATVDKIGAAGTEVQYRFIGKIEQQRPLRDWLNDILLNCLGYFSFAFGRLRLGVRVNSSSAAAFTPGNMIFGSLQVQAAGPAFNRATFAFAEAVRDQSTNTQNLFTPNTATYQDSDYASELGGGTRPVYRSAQFNLVGTASASQANRIAIVRGREESGGVSSAERKAARRVQWRTTILACDVEPGMVVSITDDQMPGGAGEVRITSMRLLGDWSVELEGRSTTDSMYDLVTGPKPADVVPDPVPPEFQSSPLKAAWMANQENPITNDVLYVRNGDLTFGLKASYGALPDRSQRLVLTVTGKRPVTECITNSQPPLIKAFTTSMSGGLNDAASHWAAICAFDSDGKFTPASNIIAFTGARSLELTEIEWPAGTYAGCALFIGDNEKTIAMQVEVTGALPATISHVGVLKPRTYNLPAPVYRAIRVKAREVVHSGILGSAVTAVSSTSITAAELIGFADLVGRVVTILADVSSGDLGPPRNFAITAFDDSTGEMTVTPNPAAASVEAGDVFTIRAGATTFSSTTIGDALFVNTLYPGGISVDETGFEVRIIAGTGRGQARRVFSHTTTVYTLERAWDVEPAGDSIFIVCKSGWAYQAESSALGAALKSLAVEIEVLVDNLAAAVYLVGAFGVDRQMGETPEELVSLREIWVPGAVDEELEALLGLGGSFSASYVQDLGELSATTNITSPVATPNEGDSLTVFWSQGATPHQITWDAIFMGVTADDNDVRPNVNNAVNFKAKADNKWWLVGMQLGRA